LRSPAWWTEASRLENAPSNHFNSLLNTNVYPYLDYPELNYLGAGLSWRCIQGNEGEVGTGCSGKYNSVLKELCHQIEIIGQEIRLYGPEVYLALLNRRFDSLAGRFGSLTGRFDSLL
jgi:hypothetical protein